MDNRDIQVLRKILEEIDFIKAAVGGIDFKSFNADEEKKRAVAMTLINVGELVRLLSEDLKKSARDIPFKEIMATRNIAAHGYYALNFNYVWDTVKTDIPELKEKISDILSRGHIS